MTEPERYAKIGKHEDITVASLFTPEFVQRRIAEMAEQKFKLEALTKDWPRRKTTRWMKLRWWLGAQAQRLADWLVP
jgi:hypothetical protein